MFVLVEPTLEKPIRIQNSYKDEILAGDFAYIFNKKELLEYGERAEARRKHTEDYFLKLGIDITEIPLPEALTNLDSPVVGRWRQIHTGNIETIITTKVLEQLGIDYLDIGFSADHYSDQSAEKKAFLEPIFCENNQSLPQLIVNKSRAHERQILGKIKTEKGVPLTEYHQRMYEHVTGKKAADISEFLSQFLAQYLLNTNERPVVWMDGSQGDAHRLEWSEKEKAYVLARIDHMVWDSGKQMYCEEKYGEGNKTYYEGTIETIDLETVIDLSKQNRARADGYFNYQNIYPALLGLVPFVPIVTPWEQDKKDAQNYGKILQEATKRITGECIPNMPIYFMDKKPSKTQKDALGQKPSLTIIPKEDISRHIVRPPQNNVYSATKEAANNLINTTKQEIEKRREEKNQFGRTTGKKEQPEICEHCPRNN